MDKKTMYTLGEICRAIWPEAGKVPLNIIDIVLTMPASGLALMIKDPANTKEKQNMVTDLVNKLPDIQDPPEGISEEVQGQFWIGYYHYLTAMEHAKNYGAKELTKAGQALFGNQWQTALSRAIGLNDARRVRQWLSGDRPIPIGVWAKIAALLRSHQTTLGNVLNELTPKMQA
jgi:hypothetical protein